jgi:hypothetical protein
MKLCDYGCGREAKYQLKNGKKCCSKSQNSCPLIRKKNSKAKKGKPRSEKTKIKISKSMKGSLKYTLKDYKERCPFLFTIEKLKETKTREIQGHCKNHNCENSKEKGGWFTLTRTQIYHRIKALMIPKGFGESNFYCSQYCKDTCILYRRKGDPYKDNNLPYTPGEIQVYNKNVLDRENGLCEYCGEPAEHVHHIFPKKLEPFFALDPDYGVACCAKHHYKYAHKDECSTGNLAKIVCSVESQKFLNQKYKEKN